jgi:hypothetical protein
MDQDKFAAFLRRARGETDQETARPREREIAPGHGTVDRSDGRVSVYCAHCHKWIECHAGIGPDAALARHGALIH